MSEPTRTISGASAVGLFMIAAAACSSPEPPKVSNAVRVAPQCEGTTASRYFPAGMVRWFPKSQSADDWTRGPSEILDAMHEPSLSCGVEPQSYRILWGHSFSGWPPTVSKWPPTMVRISQSDDTWMVTAVQLAGSVNRKEVLRHERRISGAESEE